MDLSRLKPPAGQKHAKRRIGRGMGSGRGKTSGRGQKGQRSISGFSLMRGFEGGQMPAHRRLPKRGFHNPFRREYAVINVGRLARLDGDSFDPASLVESGVIRRLKHGLKVLGTGEIARPITVKAHQFSQSAAAKIQGAGGKVEILEAGPNRPKSAKT